jgi:hypothetical protein
MVFFGVNGIGLTKIRPEGMKLISESFNDQVLRADHQGWRGSWRPGRLTHLTVYSENAAVQNARGVSERLREYGFIRLIHPPHSRD